MDTNFLTGALNAAGQQAAAGAVVAAMGAVALLTLAWIAASLAAGKARLSR